MGTAGHGQAVGEQLRRGIFVALAEPDLAEDVIHQGGRQQRTKPVEGLLHARLRGRIPAGNWRIAARIGSPAGRAHAGAAAAPSPRTCEGSTGGQRCRDSGSARCRFCGGPRAVRKVPRYVGFRDAFGSPFGSPSGDKSPLRISGSQFCLVSGYPPAHPQGDVSD